MHEPKKITEMWAWICTELDGGEGIPAMLVNGMMLPMVGADEVRIRELEPLARHIAETTGTRVRLVRFTQMWEVETQS